MNLIKNLLLRIVFDHYLYEHRSFLGECQASTPRSRIPITDVLYSLGSEHSFPARFVFPMLLLCYVKFKSSIYAFLICSN